MKTVENTKMVNLANEYRMEEEYWDDVVTERSTWYRILSFIEKFGDTISNWAKSRKGKLIEYYKNEIP